MLISSIALAFDACVKFSPDKNLATSLTFSLSDKRFMCVQVFLFSSLFEIKKLISAIAQICAECVTTMI